MQELAQQEPAIPTPKMDFTTTTASAHIAYDLTGMSVGSRVMKTQNGELISPERRDATLLAEIGVGALPAPALVPEELPKEAFTIYRHYLEKGMSTFPASLSESDTHGNPFAKQTNFSKPMDDCTKVVE